MTQVELVRWQRWLIAAHVALAVLFGVAVPPWEAHDETGHTAYIDHLVATRSLPDALQSGKVFLDQSHQPPLYYLAAAALTVWIDRDDALAPQINLFAFDGTNRHGARIVLRERGEAFPWRGAILAVHMARLVSTLLSGLMVWVIARTARRLFAGAPVAALYATAIAAFNPQVLFMAGMVNNDVMVSLMGAWLAYLIVSVAIPSAPLGAERKTTGVGRPAFTFRPSVFVLIGVALGLSLLSKNSALILIPFTIVALGYLGLRQRWPMRSFIVNGLLVLLPLLVLAAPWYASNDARYGMFIVNRDPAEPIIQAPTRVIGEGVLVSLRDGWLPHIFVNAFRTFWGKFGWGNVQMPDWVYTALFAFCAAGIAGAVWAWRRIRPDTRDGMLVLLGLGVGMALLPGYRAIYYQDPALLPGRYLMPALTAYAAWLGFGWAVLLRPAPRQASAPETPRRAHRWVEASLPVTWGLFALSVPLAIIAPVYAPPPITSAAHNEPALLTFGDVAQVIGVNADTSYQTDREGPRQYARVRLKWRALQPTAVNYAVGVSVLGWDNEVLGTTNVHPGLGNYPTSNWNPGDTFEDEYLILLEKPCARLPAMGRLSVSMYDYDGAVAVSAIHPLVALDGAGRPVAPIVGRFRIDEPAVKVPVYWQPPIGMLDGIALIHSSAPATVTAGSPFTIGLTYETWRGNNRAGIAFIHLLDEAGTLIAQDDHAPLNGAYPTDFWQRGECVRDTFSLHTLVTATGVLRAVTGFYTPGDAARFKTGTPDDVIPLGPIKIAP